MHYFISAIPFIFLFYVPTATASVGDDAFLAFVKDEPNFKAFCKKLEGKDELKIGILSSDYHNNKLDFNQKKDYLIQMYEARLGLMYLMRENWKCAEIRKEIKKEKKECEKFRKYLDILYGYLFRVYAEDIRTAADQTVKPVFILQNRQIGTLIDILEKLSHLSCFFFGLDTTLDEYTKPKLSNEGEMKYALKAANSNDTLREQFDKKLERMLEKTKKNEAKEKDELNKIEYKSQQGNPRTDVDKRNISDANSEYRTKFHIILMSPFMSVGLDDPDSDSLSGLTDTFMANDQ